MSLPQRIYRYQPPTLEAITNLASFQLWFSDPRNFNDPYDCAIDFIDCSIRDSLSQMSREQCLMVVDHMLSDQDIDESEKERQKNELMKKEPSELNVIISYYLRQNIHEHLSGFGACCFAREHDNFLMWSHYASSHKGFCMEFDSSHPIFNTLADVQYSETYPEFDIGRMVLQEKMALHEFLLTKSPCWMYEREMRLLMKEPNTLVDFEPNALTRVFCGTKMPLEQVRMIGRILRGKNVEILQMDLSTSGSFSLVPIPLHMTSLL